jgi:hypothetical protein
MPLQLLPVHGIRFNHHDLFVDVGRIASGVKQPSNLFPAEPDEFDQCPAQDPAPKGRSGPWQIRIRTLPHVQDEDRLLGGASMLTGLGNRHETATHVTVSYRDRAPASICRSNTWRTPSLPGTFLNLRS